jgi:hypothetical protein
MIVCLRRHSRIIVSLLGIYFDLGGEAQPPRCASLRSESAIDAATLKHSSARARYLSPVTIDPVEQERGQPSLAHKRSDVEASDRTSGHPR